MEEDAQTFSSLSTPSNAIASKEQTHAVSAYLDGTNIVVVKLTTPITFPLQDGDVAVVDDTAGAAIPIATIAPHDGFHPTLVGDLQHLMGATGDWNPGDRASVLREIHPNLYQLSAFLPEGTYKYKLAFNGSFDHTFPDHDVSLHVPQSGAQVTFSFVPHDTRSALSGLYDTINTPDVVLPTSASGVRTDLIAITLAQEPSVAHLLQLSLFGAKQQVIPRHVLSEPQYVYKGDDLGSIYTPRATTFRVWAPTAATVQLQLFESETGALAKALPMQKSEAGTWYIQAHGDLNQWYYLYQVEVQGTTRTAVDPYAKALAVNATRGMIVDLKETDPHGWNEDTHRPLAHPVDAVIYEVHVRDFSISPDSGMTHKGKYLAFTELGTRGPQGQATGIDSLRELGISHVQIQPIQEFASVDETDPEQYNWGYDPRNYDVPEGAYATTPHGTARVTECKQMVQSLHQAGIGVLLDVVYNHTFATHTSDFDALVPQYYYRTDNDGNYTNGSGTGNELATERPMVQKFVRDSLTFWLHEYHIDGFRFDLMALLGIETMRLISQDLHTVYPEVLLYGEPWTGGTAALPASQLLFKGRQQGLQLGVFNDAIRDGLAGRVFDTAARGFATGAPGLVDVIKRGVCGSIDDFTAAPEEVINYVTSHDNYTLWDKITLSNPHDAEADRIKMDELAQAVVMTAQGIPFMQGGEEFLRSKGGNGNSYNAGDMANQFVWSRKTQYREVFDYYAGLIHLRNNHPAFRLPSAEDIRQHLTFLDSPDNTIAFALHEHAHGDPWRKIIIIYNPNRQEASITLPDDTWNIVGWQGRVGEEVLGQATANVHVPPICCAILYSD